MPSANEIPLQVLHLGGQAPAVPPGLLALQGRGQVDAEDGLLVADQHRPLDDVLQQTQLNQGASRTVVSLPTSPLRRE